MLDGAPAGQREAARRSLQAKGIEVVTDALVTRVERASTPPAAANGAGPSGDSDRDAGRRRVHLKLGGPGPAVRQRIHVKPGGFMK